MENEIRIYDVVATRVGGLFVPKGEIGVVTKIVRGNMGDRYYVSFKGEEKSAYPLGDIYSVGGVNCADYGKLTQPKAQYVPLLMLCAYLAVSFCIWDLNPLTWWTEVRVIYLFLVTLGVYCLGYGVGDSQNR
jgi:hypothetical protein